MTGQQICTCPFCGENKTPQGIDTHTRYCDENPNQGMAYDQQKAMGLLDEDGSSEGETGGTEPRTNPDQSVSAGGSVNLPDVQTLAPNKNEGGDSREGSAECPVCGHTEVLPASQAKAAYTDSTDRPNPKAVLGYELAGFTCNDPECAALWGGKYDEPATMREVLNA